MSKPLNLMTLKASPTKPQVEESQSAEPAPTPTAPVSKGLSGLKLNLGGSRTAPAQTPASSTHPAGAVETPRGPGDSPKAPAVELAAIAGDESSGLPTICDAISGYADEIPAQAPERELPENLTEQMKEFIQALDGIYNPAVMHDPELCGQMIRRIMSELQEQPQYIRLIADDDVAVMIRGMRESMGLARLRKQESKSKRSGNGRSKKPAANQEMIDDLSALAADMGMSFDG